MYKALQQSISTYRYSLFSVATLLIVSLFCYSANANVQGFTDETRKTYLAAVDAFNKQHSKKYQRLKKQLKNYPLYPYLQFNEFKQQLGTYQNKRYTSSYSSRHYKKLLNDISDFLDKHQGSYLDKRLRTLLLKQLIQSKDWKRYTAYFQDNISSTALRCYYWRAVGYTGGEINYKAIEALWLVDRSQPDECDPLFIKWEKKKYLTDELLWQRHKLVINKRKYKLAHYLQKKMNSSTSYFARLYEKMHRQPERIKNVKTLPVAKKSLQKVADIVYIGLYRYSRKNPEKSFSLLSALKNTYPFSKKDEYKLKQYIAKNLIRNDNINLAETVLETLPEEERTEQAERLLRYFIALNYWEKIEKWTSLLPDEEAQTDRWQYWKARSLQELDKTGYKKIYSQLATSRSFHGFLAADIQNTPYALEHKPAPIDFEVIKQLKAQPAVQRTYEFYLLGYFHSARLEWKHAIKNLSEKEHIAAAHIAHIWGWHRKAIESMAKAKYWDDLTIRFPIVHQSIISKKANRYDIADALIFSIARQESAWEHDARSRVGARGLMQLMPATARETAKKANVRYRKYKLFDPEYNILLGSHYISQLIKQHGNNRALAIAAYNAGPHRVKRWLKKSNNQLGIDAWIEVIPFNETRKYVQNVLSYVVIHNSRLGKPTRLLASHEAAAQL